MARSAQLHVVARQANDERKPEDVLPFLFAREAALLADLAKVREDLADQRRRYSEAHNLRVFPGMDTLRRLFR